MFNPFKYTYKIKELQNANGETVFLATYSNLFSDLLSKLARLEIYIDCRGELSNWEKRFLSLDGAKQAVENHKSNVEKVQKSQFKTTAIHYVE